jgi:tetratricopeptide (TPR) repeat protein
LVNCIVNTARIAAVCLAAMILLIGEPALRAQQQPQALSLLGKLLVPAAPSGDARDALEADLAAARAAVAKDPHDAMATLALGRATAGFGLYREAIEILTTGIEAHADEPRLYRYRGEWYIAIRRFDLAIKDLTKAADLIAGKPAIADGEGSLDPKVHFLLGAAHYLKWDFTRASDEWQRAGAAATSAEDRQMIAHWLYTALRRLNKPDEAKQAVQPFAIDTLAPKDQPYARLLALYRGRAQPDDVSGGKGTDALVTGYGVAAWYLYNDKLDAARSRLHHIVDKYEREWPVLDYIAAEADYARVVKMRKKRK